jgi:hypothetical protein
MFSMGVRERYSVCATTTKRLEQMQQCVSTTAAQIDREMLPKVWAKVGNQIDIRRITHGAHTLKDCDIIPQSEQLYCNFKVFIPLCGFLQI